MQPDSKEVMIWCLEARVNVLARRYEGKQQQSLSLRQATKPSSTLRIASRVHSLVETAVSNFFLQRFCVFQAIETEGHAIRARSRMTIQVDIGKRETNRRICTQMRDETHSVLVRSSALSVQTGRQHWFLGNYLIQQGVAEEKI